jgi:hypothetical protein
VHISAQKFQVPVLRAAAQKPVPSSPVDQLPDLSTIEARAAQTAPATTSVATASTISSGKKAALLALGLGTALMAAAPSASAHGYGYGYGHHHQHYQGNAGAILGGAIVGAIIGGIISDQAPPVYYPPQPVYQTPYYDGYNRLICPSQTGGWYVSPDNVRCW